MTTIEGGCRSTDTAIDEEAEADQYFREHTRRHEHLRAVARDNQHRFGVNAIVRVGGGRGFVVETKGRRRLVITAAHCLPDLPEAASFLSEEERFYPQLLGALGEEPPAGAACEFVDPIADIAVLGSIQIDEAFDELAAYVRPLRVARTPRSGAQVPVRMLGLDGKWLDGTVMQRGGGLWLGGIGVEDPDKPRFAGLSGSPILDAHGRAIGVFGSAGTRSPHGLQPRLDLNLPGWLLQELRFGRRRD